MTLGFGLPLVFVLLTAMTLALPVSGLSLPFAPFFESIPHAGRGATAPAGENRHVPGTCEVPGTSAAILRAGDKPPAEPASCEKDAPAILEDADDDPEDDPPPDAAVWWRSDCDRPPVAGCRLDLATLSTHPHLISFEARGRGG